MSTLSRRLRRPPRAAGAIFGWTYDNGESGLWYCVCAVSGYGYPVVVARVWGIDGLSWGTVPPRGPVKNRPRENEARCSCMHERERALLPPP